jgi:hypothetical protein
MQHRINLCLSKKRKNSPLQQQKTTKKNNNNMFPAAISEPAIKKLTYASNLLAFTKEFIVLTLEKN